MTNSAYTKADLELAANTIRFLAADGVERAKSGHPGMPMGMAEISAVLWLKHLRFNPKDPQWIARDRFVLSNGHGSMLLYTMLHLSGYALSLDDLKSFRQWESKTPGHPEFGMTPGVETTTGPLGQGMANAVGMALGQKLMQERYAEADFNPVGHRVYCFAGDGCLMEGVSSEASSIAGHLGLGNLICIYDDNKISIAGSTELAFSEDVAQRFAAYGWHVQQIDGHDFDQIDRALRDAQAEQSRPSIIVARTTIGRGSPRMANTSEVHGSPLGAEELAASKKNMGWPADKEFYVPAETQAVFAARIEALQNCYAAWQENFARWQQSHPDTAKKLAAQLALAIPADLEAKLISALPADGKPNSTRKLSSVVLQQAAASISALAGGSADLEPSTLTLIKGSPSVARDCFKGVNIHFGVREHAMGSIMNGLSYYGGYIPYGSTFFAFLDYMRPSVRLAALSHLPALYIFTHDSIFLGEDGPTHQPVEHLAIMRATPNLFTYRPADGLETAVCYAHALSRRHGPSALILTRQNLEQLERSSTFSPAEIRKGAYVVFETAGAKEPAVVIVATGSEVACSVQAAKILSAKCAVRVVSMPCTNLFLEQPESYRRALLPQKAKKVVVEAASPFGWAGILGAAGDELLVLGIENRFGASAPLKVLAEKFGFTAEAIAQRVSERFC